MNTPTEAPLPYRVVYSEYVRAELRQLAERAAARGLGRLILDAVKELDRRLRIYPQFGQPLRDLSSIGETAWIGTVGPVVAHYVLDEEKRLVFIIAPFRVLSRFGL